MRIKLIFNTIIILLSCTSSPHSYLREGRELSQVKKVAVLPFKNITDHREAGKIITNMFVQKLFNSNIYSVEEMGNIRDFFVRQRIREKGEVDLDTISMLGAQLGTDAVILGTVEEYYQKGGGRGETSPKVGLSVRMLSIKTGAILWKCHHQRSGDDYIIVLDWGKVRTANLLALKVIGEIISTLR